jgi:hypothetical protein
MEECKMNTNRAVVDTEKLKEIEAEFRKRYQDKVIVDGIVCQCADSKGYEAYAQDEYAYDHAEIRILWILKEPNQNEKKEWCFR